MADLKDLAEQYGVLKDKLNAQNFEDNDSMIASTILHPVEAAKRYGQHLNDMYAIATDQLTDAELAAAKDAGYDEESYPLYAMEHPIFRTDAQKAEAGMEFAGLAQTGAMPFAPASAGGTLGMAIKAYHGTPHLFDRFDMSKIGTGEGAQAYGHGLYFAENPLVAKTYMTAGVPVDEYQNKIFLKKYNADIAKLRGDKEKEAALLQEIKDMEAQKGGNLYETSIRWPNAEREAMDPLGEHHLLDWDQPVESYVGKAIPRKIQELQNARDAISSKYDNGEFNPDDLFANTYNFPSREDQIAMEKIAEEINMHKNMSPAFEKGAEGSVTYHKLAKMLGSPEKAAEYLHSIDIPGLKYLDATSRSTDKGTRNYVMFGDEYPEIIKRAGSLDELQEKYAEGGIVKAQDQNENLGKLAEMLGSARDVGNQYTVPSWVPLAGGVGAGDLLMGKTPEEIENWSYGNAPMQIPEMSNVPQFKRGRAQSLADAMTTLAPGVKATEGLPAGLSFIGPKSRNWDKVAAELAAKKLDEGADPAEVWREHLIGRMPDKTLFSEISDKDAQAIPKDKWSWANSEDLRRGERIMDPVSAFLSHPELHNAYHGMIDFGDNNRRLMMNVSPERKGGFFGDDIIGVGMVDDAIDKSTAMHELQHAIQDQEGWGQGGDLGSAASFYIENHLSPKLKALNTSLIENGKLRDTITNEDEYVANVLRHKQIAAERDKLNDEISNIENNQAPKLRLYNRLAGEAQARATQDRLDMDMAQRRENYPLAGGKLSDIPLKDLIYKYEGDGPSLDVEGYAQGGRVDKDSLQLDKPQRTPNHPTKSHIVKTMVDGKENIIRFGEQGAETAGKPKEGESDRMTAKRESFKARHAKNIAKGKSSAAYWADKVKWAEGGEVDNGYAKGGEVDAAIEDYKQLLSGYPNAEKFFTGLKDAAYRSVPTTEQMRDPNFIIDNAGFGGIIKPKGGNFVKGASYYITPEDAAMRYSQYVDPDVASAALSGKYSPTSYEYKDTIPKVAVNDWLQQKLAKYIKNEMGTPEDPVRRIAEEWPAKRDVLISQQKSKIPNLQEFAAKYEEMGLPSEVIANRMANAQRETAGIQDKISELENYNPLHYTPNKEISPYNDVEELRKKAGYPVEGIAKSDLAKLWEHYADNAFTVDKAKELLDTSPRYLQANPWLESVPENQNVYAIKSTDTNDTGFYDLANKLRNATHPDTDLPDFLRIDPAKLSRVSMPQAVEHVAKINAWREAEKLKEGRNAATVMHKEYPDQGLAWMQMKMPEPTLQEGHYLGEDSRGNPAVLDASGGEWASASTPEEALADYRIAERRDALQAALKFEGDTMGHCVGQYCDEVGSGKSNIYSLRDRRGEPHVTIETSKPADEYLYYNMLMDKLPYDEQAKLITDVREYNAANPHLGMKKSAINFMKDLYGPPQEKIVQIKGKQNAAPNEKYLPAIHDFVRSKDWSSVGDFENTLLTDLNKSGSQMHPELYKAATDKYGRFVTDDELNSLRDEFYERNKDIPLKGFAKGGSVQALHDKYEESDYGYGNRPDKTKKGLGYFGELERPDGTGVMTEYSIGVPINGKEMDVPTLVPTLTLDEIRLILHLQEGEDMPRSIVHKAIDHAHQRLSQGKPIFATEEDLYAHGGIVDVLHNDAIEQIMKAFIDSMEDEQEEEEPAAVSIQITTHSQPLKSGKIPTSIREAKHG
jgi:hypothetical protein